MRIAQNTLIRAVTSIALLLSLFGCVGIAGDNLDTYIGTRFTNPNPQRANANAQTGNAYYRDGGIYKEEKEGSGRRVYINYFRHCRYSLLIDENDIIRSWRDEGGRVHMRDCKFS